MAKNYRMKNPISHTKAAIGKFQTKHPFLSLLVEAPIVVGAGAGIAQAAGLDIFPMLRDSGIQKVPVAGKLYMNMAEAVYQMLQ